MWIQWLLLLLAFAKAGSSHAAEWAFPKPKIYIYDDFPVGLKPEQVGNWHSFEEDLKPPGSRNRHGPLGALLTYAIKVSEYYEPDPAKADYFWIPSGGDTRNATIISAVIEHIRATSPWWKRDVEEGTARHMLFCVFDHGCGATFARGMPNTSLDNGLPLDYHPASPKRVIMYLQFNGKVDGAGYRPNEDREACVVCFQKGKDIVVPIHQQNACTALCGYNETELRQESIWSPDNPNAADKELGHKRPHTMFWSGYVGPNKDPKDHTGRGGVVSHHGNRKKWLIRDSSNPDFEARKKDHLKFTQAMKHSEFCYVPTGAFGGQPDRHIAAMLFGCIPVMLNTSGGDTPQGLPYEEVLPWHEFATLADAEHLQDLHKQIQCLMPQVPKMRSSLDGAWQAMLWTSFYGNYVGEGEDSDAFIGLMRVLGSRIPHGYKPSPEKMAAIQAHPGTLFPCRPDSPAA